MFKLSFNDADEFIEELSVDSKAIKGYILRIVFARKTRDLNLIFSLVASMMTDTVFIELDCLVGHCFTYDMDSRIELIRKSEALMERLKQWARGNGIEARGGRWLPVDAVTVVSSIG